MSQDARDVMANQKDSLLAAYRKRGAIAYNPITSKYGVNNKNE